MRVVHHLLHQGLADALHRTAFNLALDDGRADHTANVVDAGVGHHLDLPGLGVDFHLGHMACVGPAGGAGLGRGADHQALTGLRSSHFEQAHTQVRARDLKTARVVLDVRGRGFQSLGRQVARDIHGALGRHANRCTAREQGPAGGTAKAVGAVGVALQHTNAVRGQAKNVVGQLHIAGGNALAHGHGGAGEFNVTVGCELDADGFIQGIAAGPFQESGQAAPAQASACTRLGSTRLKARPVRQHQPLVQHAFKLPAVIDLPHGVGVGHLLGPHHVATAQLRAVQAHLAGGGVHQPLHQVDGLGPTGATVGPGGRVVGEHRAQPQADAGHVVNAGADQRPDVQRNGQGRVAGIGPHVGQRAHPQGQDATLRVQGQLGVAVLAAALHGGHKVLHALGLPLDGAAQLQGGPGQHDVFRVDARLHAKAAAHVTDQHTHVVCAAARQDVNQRSAHPGGHLAAHAQGQFGAVHGGQHAARLHAGWGHALVDQVQGHRVRGPLEGGFNRSRITVLNFSGHVVVGFAPHTWCAGCDGLQGVCHGGVFFVVDPDAGRCQPGSSLGISHHSNHRLPDKANPIHSQGPFGW